MGVIVLVAAAFAITLALRVGATPDATAGSRRLAPHDVKDAVRRTVAAGSARLQATYRPAHGPPVTVSGRTSFSGPEAEVEAVVAGEAPARVRVTASGSWWQPPGSPAWLPVPDAVAAARSLGWADVLRTLDPSRGAVWADGHGRIIRVRLAPDRAGGVLDVRFSAFGIQVVTVPP